jgi:MoxR-like ATPase
MTTAVKNQETTDQVILTDVTENVTEVKDVKAKESLKGFVFADEVGEALDLAFATNENLILFGPGGYGKSEMVEAFFKAKGIEPFVKTMGSGTTTDVLFGGIDVPLFNKKGAIEFLVENSFMNHKYVVFEELFDAPDYILEQLKDILTSKTFRNGNQKFKIKTELIICCTNKTREEFGKNDSLKALLERFPLEYKVFWDAHTRDTYNFLFKEVLKTDNVQLSYILEKLVKNGTVVSPRTAVKAAKIVEQCGMECLSYVADFSGKNKEIVRLEIEKYKNLEELEKATQRIKVEIEVCKKYKLDSLENIKAASASLNEIKKNVHILGTKKIDDEIVEQIKKKINLYNKFIEKKENEIKQATNF